MPKPNVVFRADFQETESDDDEVVIIPYTKPAPVVIDLLESDSSNSSSTNSKKSPKKKSKKKKSKRDRERSSGSTNVASLDDTTGKSSVSSPIVVNHVSQQNNRPPDDDDDIEEIICDQVVEPATSSEVERGSGNVVAEPDVSINKASSTSAQIQDIVGKRVASSSSSLEKSSNTQSTSNTEAGKSTQTGVEMAGTTPAPGGSGKEKRPKSKEKKTRGEGKSRTRTMSATQRTNEEILNFLTTLGIQMESSAFDTPVTRRRQTQKRKRQAEGSQGAGEASLLNTSVASGAKEQNISTTSTPRAFVSVTQDTTPAAKRDIASTPKRKRQAISGDLSDYTITFTNKDLNAINTNIQSNVVIPETDNGVDKIRNNFVTLTSREGSKEKTSTEKSGKTIRDYYDEVIDAVARGLDSSKKSPNLEMENSGTTEIPKKKIDSSSGQKEQTEMETDAVTNPEINEADSTSDCALGGQVQDSAHSSKSLEKISESSTAAASCVISSSISSSESDRVDNLSKPGSGNKHQTETIAEPDVIIIESSNSDDDTRKKSNGSTESTCSGSNSTVSASQKASCEQSHQNESSANLGRDNKRKHDSTEDRETTTPGKHDSSFNRHSPERKRQRQDKSPRMKNVIRQTLADTRTNHKEPVRHQVSTVNTGTNHLPPEPYFPTTWSGDMRDFYGASRDENFDTENVMSSLRDSEHLWKANRDLMPPPKIRRHVRCDKCKQVGHFARECTEEQRPPTCHYCGKTGHSSDHNSRHRRPCPNTKCLNCGHKTSTYCQKCPRCLMQRQQRRCEICNVIGHSKELCPDNWRRYHSVTSSEEYENVSKLLATNSGKRNGHREHSKTGSKDSSIYKTRSATYCANCGHRGHSYYDCPRSKFNLYPRHKPFTVLEAKLNDASRASESCEAAIPISYDSRTGRTVVMSSEADHQPSLTVETIQVKITNELALSKESNFANKNPVQEVENLVNSGPPIIPSDKLQRTVINHSKYNAENRFACDNKRCRNTVRKYEKCYQTVMQPNAHLKLLRDYNKGYVKPLEEKHQVQISVLNDGYKVHISGSGALEAEVDLLHILRQRIHSGRENSSAEETNENFVYQVGSVLKQTEKLTNTINDLPIPHTSKTAPPVFLVDDEEDECSVIVEVASKNLDSTPKVMIPTISESAHHTKSIGSADVVLLDDKPFQVTIVPERVSEKVQVHAEISTEKKNEDGSCNNPSSNSVWSDYVSPLTGLPLSTNQEGSSTASTVAESSSASGGILWDLPNHQAYEVTPSDDAVPTTSTNLTLNEEITPNSPKDDSFEVEEFDYSNFLNTDVQNQQSSKEPDMASNSSSDLSKDSSSVSSTPSIPNNNVEIITLDDNEGQPMLQNMANDHEERVSLIPSEWELTVTESAKHNSIIKQIAEEFDVTVVVSKETNSILIRNGRRQALKLAKDEIVYWLETKCMNMDYHFVRRRAGTREAPRASPSKRNMKRKQDLQNQNFNKRKNNKKKRKAINNFLRNQTTNFPLNRSSPSSPSSSSGFQSFSSASSSSSLSKAHVFKKSGFIKLSSSPPANLKRQSQSPVSRREQKPQGSVPNNDNTVRFPIPSAQMHNNLPTPRARYFHK